MATTPAGSAPQANIDFGRCFAFVTEDPDWVKKILIGGGFTLASMMLVGLPFIAGYWSRLLKRVAAGEARPLPEWDDLGGIFGDGLRLVGLYFAYVFAVGLVIGLLACPLGLMFGGLGAFSRRSEAMAGFEAFGVMGMLGLYAVFFVLMLALNLVLPAAAVRVTMTGDFAQGFAFREIVGFIRANLGNYLLSIVVYLVASFLSQFGVLLCCVGLFPAAFYAYSTLGYALGETVRLNPASV
jgi:hypothetical protein